MYIYISHINYTMKAFLKQGLFFRFFEKN